MKSQTTHESTNRAENDRTNPLQADSVSDEHRAQLLERWARAIRDCFGEAPLLMPLGDDKKPLTITMGSIEAAESTLVEPKEAARRIRQDGAEGFYMYAGLPNHRTEYLVILDHDDLDVWPADAHRPTVRVMSGSGKFHNHYRNDPNDPIRNADVPDGGGELHAHRRGVVVPGSIHESGGIYHMTDDPGVATLADSDLDDRERPKGPTVKSLDDVDLDSLDTDLEVIGDVRGCIRRMVADLPPNHTARDRMQSLIDGKYRARGFKSDDGSGDRSRAELALFRYIYGAVVEYGDKSQQEAAEATAQYLTHLFEPQEERVTQDCQPRKWLVNPGRYRQRIVSLVVGTHEPNLWQAWRDKQERDDYHPMIYRHLMDAINMDCLVGTGGNGEMYNTDQYPDGRRVRTVAAAMNNYGLSDETYRTALFRLVDRRGTVKMACLEEHAEYVYYPAHAPDPPEAEWVKDSHGKHDSNHDTPT